jgi:hypothetical protein
VPARSHDAVALLLLLCLTLPFLDTAHKIDDPLYLAAASQVLAHPFDPLGGSSFWHERPGTLFFDLYNPPLTAYLLALPVALDGGREAGVHALMLLLAALALLACSAAGEAWGVPRRYTLLIATSPALCVSAVSAMTDVPFLCLCALAWGQARRGRSLSCGLAVGFAALTKYVGLLNLPLVLLELRRHPRRRSAAFAAVVLFGAYCLWNLAANGAWHVRSAARFQEFGLERQAVFLASFVASLGLVGLPAVLGLLRWSPGLAAAALASGATGAAWLDGRPGSPVLAFVAFGSGGALLWAAGQACRRVGEPFLRAAFWTFALYTTVLVYFGTARYLLPLLPLLLWLLVRGGLVADDAPRWRFAASVGGGALLSLALLRADTAYADAWRHAARQLPSAARGFHTGRWGFAWYARERGYLPLAPRQRLQAGDLVAEPSGIHVVEPAPAQAVLLVPHSTQRSPSPALRVMDPLAGAGFYSSFWGVLPFAWRSPAEEHVQLATPDPELLAALARPVSAPVSIDLGSDEARYVTLDGWSYPESFSDSHEASTTFVWAVGQESALRLPLPAGVRRMALRVSPLHRAVGRLRVRIGEQAHAVMTLAPGWHSYEAPIDGHVPGGVTDVVLEPAGYRRPGPFATDRRELSLAVDFVVFGDGYPASNRGVWPVRDEAGRSRLFVSDPAAPAAATRLTPLGGSPQNRP